MGAIQEDLALFPDELKRLADAVWGRTRYVSKRTIEQLAWQLRKKLETISTPACTLQLRAVYVWGIGWTTALRIERTEPGVRGAGNESRKVRSGRGLGPGGFRRLRRLRWLRIRQGVRARDDARPWQIAESIRSSVSRRIERGQRPVGGIAERTVGVVNVLRDQATESLPRVVEASGG